MKMLASLVGIYWRCGAADGQDHGSGKLHAEGKSHPAEAQVAVHQPAHAGRQPHLPPGLWIVMCRIILTFVEYEKIASSRLYHEKLACPANEQLGLAK